MGIALLFYVRNSQETPMGLYGLLQIALLFYVGGDRTSQETYLSASTACYTDSFSFLYVDDAHTS
jgi:hypothetical protein